MSDNTFRPSLDQFAKDVENHQMQVLVDDEVHRSLLFKQPDTGNMYFRINTWPNHLCISGDMGTFVFSRLHDMFAFFRGDKEPNLGYWSEKLEAGTAEKYCEDKARSEILRQANEAGLEPLDLKQAINNIADMDQKDAYECCAADIEPLLICCKCESRISEEEAQTKCYECYINAPENQLCQK